MRVGVVQVARIVAALIALAGGMGCAEKIASLPRPSLDSCGGLFTTVALPPVSRDEERTLERVVPQLASGALDLRLRRSYYRIVYEDEGGAPGPEREAYAAKMLAEEQAPPGLLAGVRLRGLRFAVPPPPEREEAVRHAVLRARAPLARRLDRVAARVVAAAGGSDVSWRLDANQGLNAGAEVGFRTRRILVGPSLVLLAESEDALAFVIGHELAHVLHHHTKLRAAQDLVIDVLTFGHGSSVAAEAIAGILSHGSMPAFNRDKECEADYYALEYMRAAGYRPEATGELWKALLALRAVDPRQKIPFVSGRPRESERVLRLAQWAHVDLFEGSSSQATDGSEGVRNLTTEDAVESFGVALE
jgi:Zn-dependent protease with chaperone function